MKFKLFKTMSSSGERLIYTILSLISKGIMGSSLHFRGVSKKSTASKRIPLRLILIVFP